MAAIGFVPTRSLIYTIKGINQPVRKDLKVAVYLHFRRNPGSQPSRQQAPLPSLLSFAQEDPNGFLAPVEPDRLDPCLNNRLLTFFP